MSSAFRFLHAADIHLDSPLKGLSDYHGAPVPLVRHATRTALSRVVEIAISQVVDFVLISGDLYDGTWPDQSTGLFFSQQMSRLRSAEIPVFVIRGNHDAASRVTEHLELPENVWMFPPGQVQSARHEVLERLQVRIFGHSYPQPAVLDSVISQFPQADPTYFHIGMLHTALEGDALHQRYAPCSIDDLRSKNYQYWALGHVHQRRVCQQSPWVVYPGNIQGRHIRETGAKGCYVVDVDSQRNCRLTFHGTEVIRWRRLEVSLAEVEDRETAATLLRQYLRDALQSGEEAADSETADLPFKPADAWAIRLVIRADRVTLTRLQRWHDWLVADCRSLLTDLSVGRVWLERVRLESEQRVSRRSEVASGPRQTLQELVDGAQADFDLKTRLRVPLQDLLRKLPPEIVEELDPLRHDDSALAARLIDLPQLIDSLEFGEGG